jgi:pSer/pThr/pTyr-binding forkhead associated (FHA) protein
MMATEVNQQGDPLAQHTLSPKELKHVLATERDGEPFLAFRDQEDTLRLFLLSRDQATRTVGRGADMSLSLPWDSEVSSVHAELERLGSEWTILDDGLSRNGTYVNGERINGRHRLRDGDVIGVGHTTLAYNAANSSAEGTTVTAKGQAPIPQLNDSQRRVLVALCRPYRDGATFATPASNQQIASETFLSLDAVKMNLRILFARFELSELPQNQKRARLAECALQFGAISQRDLA